VSKEPPNEALRDLAALVGDEATREIVLLFLRDFPESMRGLAASSREDQIRITHGLRNSALHMGAEGLSRQMGAIEDRLGRPGEELAPQEVADAMAGFEAFATDLRSYAGDP
jgi:hypothetical protein